MSATNTRLHRSELAVPGSNIRMLEKAPDLGADIVMLDLDDGGAAAPGDLDDPPAEEATDADDRLIAGLQQVGQTGLHAGRPGGREGQHDPA